MKNNLLLVALLGASGLLSGTKALAQEVPPCGTYQMMDEYKLRNPEYARQIAEYEASISQISQIETLRGTQLTNKVIPVVIHIIHNNGSSNISQAQIMNAMDVLNKDFNKLNSDSGQVIAAFQPIAANPQISFRLARLDPNGNCTEGITRTYSTLTTSAGENVKNLVRWDPTKYLNVWVVQSIASGAGGYSYLPCVSNNMDGIVIRNSQFGTIGTSSPFGLAARSFTHEVGHYLGLPHTWGGSNTPGLATNCDIDDGISDTPNTVGVSGGACNTGASTCGNLNNVQNYMDYSNCPKMFTIGQKAVMQNALLLGCRATLWNQNNLEATGTNDGFSILSCTPAVAFTENKTRICAGSVISFSDQSYNPAFNPNISRQWSFPGGTPSTSTDPNPIVQYSNPGVYNVSLTVTNQGGPTTVIKQSLIEVVSTVPVLALPLYEGFESATFPVVPADTLKNWVLQNSTTNTWQRTNAAAIEGSHSLRIRHGFIPPTRVNAVVTPLINLTTVPQPKLKFKTAYSLPVSQGSASDRFQISYSTDCGETWQVLFDKQGSSLATVSTPESDFVPNGPAEWRLDSVALPNINNLLLKFESISGNGNTFYLDAVNIGNAPLVGLEEHRFVTGIAVYPNPNNGQATIKYELAQAGKTRITLTNMLGMQVAASEVNQQVGVQEVQLSSFAGRLAPGVYAISFEAGKQKSIRKLVIQ